MRNRISILVVIAVFLSFLLFVVQYLYRHVLKLPSPSVLVDLEFDLTPKSQSFRLFASRPLARSTHPVPFGKAAAPFDDTIFWKGGKSTIDNFLNETQTRAFLMIQNGNIAYEKYSSGYDRDSKFASYSVAKSFVATLVGAAISDGKIRSLQDPIGNYLAAGDVWEPYRRVTIGELLSMRSGIDVDERYDSALAPVVQMYLTTDLNHFLSGVSEFRYPAGQHFEYRSVDTLVLASVLKRATGMALTEYAEQKLWHPLGTANDATWSVDSAEHDVEKAFCCLNATARDFAKLGMLYLAQGTVNGNRIVSKAWTLVPSASANQSIAMAYSDGWWIPPDNARDGDFSAIGIYGQYVYVNPLTQTIIVKLSEYGAEQDELATLSAMRQIAHSVSGVR
ncbi:serine hydrolase domain-containing protein [Burkholderia stagnalis]|uniref:serine hydrolase domain-containing protein n=1 Tax=Burkholderia stagnalis TaxID=1503054 RepID=UPI0007570C86|nr:serine hydrolase [Burkholderia stagnalis]KVO50466.1 serine hydrolase [Burkholderia stagnalis]KVP08376.1 serine hydrolase [Burkholderia stagnalis]KVW93177.1 serine hydrolase [Burkholderia stagnalis]KWH71933.1 serine hydrolase [Burkholderia stagnalis]KWK17362.1 serine hydrolase [Burkholderia stagnalis]